MNIKIPYSWLTEFVKTGVKPEDLAKDLSLCSASVERIETVDGDKIFDIEVTTNRVDMMGVYGMSREAAAILPVFGIKAALNAYPETLKLKKSPKVNYLNVNITEENLCPHFAALLIENVRVKNSPPEIAGRLEKVGVRSLNNLIDITNYCMYELGQPMHVFDYDKIGKKTMVLRESREGEEITTLDGIKRKLSPGTIIIEDGNGKIIDLCGIMGGQNSAVGPDTKNVLLFVQNYDPSRIRRTCQELSFRTDAAVRFEKNLDKDGVFPALERAALLFKNLTDGRLSPTALDLYPHPYKEKTVILRENDIKRLLGIEIAEKKVISILSSLQFKVKKQKEAYLVSVPSFRAHDVTIPEDLIEEIARVYGYFNLPSLLPPTAPPQTLPDPELTWEKHLKTALKYWGFTETYTFSLVPEDYLFEKDQPHALKLVNPLTLENEYLRSALLPSLLNVVSHNQAGYENLKIFEISMTYEKQGKNKLPLEKPKLAVVINNGNFFDIKGVLEQIFADLGRTDFNVGNITENDNYPLFDLQKSALLPDNLGIFGEINRPSKNRFNLKGNVAAAEIDCQKLFSKATTLRKYLPSSTYPAVIEDLTLLNTRHIPFAEIINIIRSTGKFITNIEMLGSYKDRITLRVYYQSMDKTLTSDEIRSERENILKKLAGIGITLKLK